MHKYMLGTQKYAGIKGFKVMAQVLRGGGGGEGAFITCCCTPHPPPTGTCETSTAIHNATYHLGHPDHDASSPRPPLKIP